MTKRTNEHPSVTFLKSLYQHCDKGLINLRFLPSGENQFISLKKIDSIPSILEAHKGQNVHFGVATRRDGDGTKEGIVEIPSLWCEVDTEGLGEEAKNEIRQRYQDFPLKPSFLLNSGGGFHIYWKLKTPATKEEIRQIESLLKRIALYFGGDLSLTDASRILRLPKTLNHKYDPPREVTITAFKPQRECNLSDFDFLPPLMETSTKEERPYSQENSLRLNQIMECEFLKHCDRDRGNLSEPEWYAMVSILARETGGLNLIHSLSNGYPKYSPGETDKKILHAINDAGPATCERIKSLWNCGKDCGVKSPVALPFKKFPDESRVSASEDWPDPIPFDEYSSLPDFPLGALSGIGCEVVEAVSEVNQVDPALTACLYLAVLSSSFAKKVVVDLRSHQEPLNLYLCPVYDSGNRKSSTTSDMTNPLYEFQKARQEDMRTIIQDAQNAFRIKEKRIERLQKKAAEEDDPEQRRQSEEEAAELTRALAETPIPNSPIYLVDDVTPEKLGVLMADNGERMAVITPEGGLFEIMAGRYSKDGVGNIDLFLKAHNGDFWGNHRIGREAKTMEAPALTLCLAVQSGVIEEAGKNQHFRGKGLLARFLYSRCKSQVGYRKRQTTSLGSSLIERYKTHIFSLMDIPFKDAILRLSPDAQRLWDEFYDDIEQEMRPGKSLCYLPDWGSKLPGAVARIAGLLHLAERGIGGLSSSISVTFVSASCVIGAYFKEHATAVFGLMQEDRKFKLARQILSYLNRVRPATFKGRDIMHHTAISLMEEVEQGLRVLADRGYIREETGGLSNPGPGRPSGKTYRVNPKIFERRNV